MFYCIAGVRILYISLLVGPIEKSEIHLDSHFVIDCGNQSLHLAWSYEIRFLSTSDQSHSIRASLVEGRDDI